MKAAELSNEVSRPRYTSSLDSEIPLFDLRVSSPRLCGFFETDGRANCLFHMARLKAIACNFIGKLPFLHGSAKSFVRYSYRRLAFSSIIGSMRFYTSTSGQAPRITDEGVALPGPEREGIGRVSGERHER